MAVTDLTGTTWVLNDTIIYANINPIISFNFTSNNTSFYGFYFDVNSDGDNSLGYRTNQQYSFNQIYNSGGDIISGKEAYKTITITGGTDATNSALISWLEANATQQAVSTKVSVDLTTLSGWSALPPKTYDITIVAKADGYKDSEPSAAVSFTKGTAEGYTVTIIEENVAATYTVYINGVGVPRDSSNIRVFHNVKTFNIECPVTGNRIYNATGSLTNVSWNSGFAYSEDIDITEDSSASLDTDQ